MHDLQRRDRNAPIRSIMLDIWLVYWIPVSKGMEDAMSTPRIPPEDCPCGKAQTCYECTHPPSERDKVLDDYCIIDLTYYVWAEAESDDVRLCQGKECNYCGRYNAKLQRAGSP